MQTAGPRGATVGYGAAALGNLYREISDSEAAAIVDAAWDAQIRHFDTAPHYGVGVSESRLGAALVGRPREEYTVSTKVGRLLVPASDGTLVRTWDFSGPGLRASLEGSLSRTGLDRFDTVYLHDPEQSGIASALAEGLPALAALRDEGLFTRAGVGSTDVATLLSAAETGLIDCVMIAGKTTLLDDSASRELLPLCRSRRIRVTAAAVFNSGILASDDIPDTAKYGYEPARADTLARARRLRDLCRSFGVPLPSVAVQFAARQDAVEQVVVGADSGAQLAETIEHATLDIPDQLWAALTDIIEETRKAEQNA